MGLYIDKKVEQYEHELIVVQLKKNSFQYRLYFERDSEERKNLQLEIDRLLEQIIKLKEIIAKYYPNNLSKLF